MTTDVSRTELFESMPVRKALMTMSVPTITSQLINLLYNIVDAIYIGQTGDAYKTAAVTLVFPIFMMTSAFGNLFGVGGGSLFARLVGRGTHEKAAGACSFSFHAAVAVSILYSLLIGFFMNPILCALGASSNTLEFARQYVILVLVIGNLPIILSLTAAHLLRNAGYSREASRGLIAGGVLNMALDPVFMFVLLPDGMEVFGAALATLVSNVISCIYLAAAIHRLSQTSSLCIRPGEIKVLGRAEYGELFSVGVPSALLLALFNIANIFLNSLIAAYGDLQLAGIGISMKAERLPTAINLGLSQGMMPIVAYNFASGNYQRMNEVIRTARRLGLLISAVTLTLYEVFAPLICRVFLNTAAGNVQEGVITLGFAITFMRIRCVAAPVQFLNYNTSYCMQAVGYGAGTLLHVVARELVFYVPFMLILNQLFGLYGLIGALTAGELCGALFALLLFRYWKRMSHIPAL